MAEGKKTERPSISTITDLPNPFLNSRTQPRDINLTRTGYRMRSDYINALTVLKTLKKGYTLEAVLDEVLTFYFKNAEDGKLAVEKTESLYS